MERWTHGHVYVYVYVYVYVCMCVYVYVYLYVCCALLSCQDATDGEQKLEKRNVRRNPGGVAILTCKSFVSYVWRKERHKPNHLTAGSLLSFP